MKTLFAFLTLLTTIPAFAEEPAKPVQLYCYIESANFGAATSFKAPFNEVSPGVFYASAKGQLAGNLVSARAYVSSMGPVIDVNRTLEDLSGEIRAYSPTRQVELSWAVNGGKYTTFCRIE